MVHEFILLATYQQSATDRSPRGFLESLVSAANPQGALSTRER